MIYSSRAEEDLDRILHYLIGNYSTETARKAYRLILDQVQSIAGMPSAKPIFHRGKELYRNAISKNGYRIIYSVQEIDREVFLYRILHVKMNKPTIISVLE